MAKGAHIDDAELDDLRVDRMAMAIEKQTEMLEKVLKRPQPAPVVNVTVPPAPEQKAPVVNVTTPEVNVNIPKQPEAKAPEINFPPHPEPRAPIAYTLTVMKRDVNGRIAQARLDPIPA